MGGTYRKEKGVKSEKPAFVVANFRGHDTDTPWRAGNSSMFENEDAPPRVILDVVLAPKEDATSDTDGCGPEQHSSVVCLWRGPRTRAVRLLIVTKEGLSQGGAEDLPTKTTFLMCL